jgi:hypothetical protein
MSIYAKINFESYVENLIVCEDDLILTQPGKYAKVTESTKNAGHGYFYDEINNKFICPKPYESWILNENFDWQPVSGPSPEGIHIWNEENQEWVPVVPSQE